MSGLPNGWAAAALPAVCSKITDGTHHSPVNLSSGDFKYVTAKNIRPWGLDLSDISYVDTKTHDEIYARCPVEKGDVLYIKDGATTGLAVINSLDEPFSMLSSVALLKPNREVLHSGYLKHWLNSPDTLSMMLGKMTGTAIRRLTLTTLSAQNIPLPPVAEQRRIVAKVDGLTARTARARKELDRIPTLVARYKQRFLALAFSGKLTASWRKENLQRETDEKRLDYTSSQDGRERGAWEWDALPNGWNWVPFEAAFVDVTDSKRKLPTSEYKEKGRFPIVDQGAAQIAGYTDREDVVQLANPPYVVFGDHTRCVKLVSTPFVQGADGVKVLNPKPHFDVAFLYYALRCVRLPDKGYSRHMKFLRATFFPLCSLEEQAEIVRRIVSAFGWLDRMAADHGAAALLLPKLDAAVLAKAFRGELLPQDSEDEPASVLLERLQAERTAEGKGTNKGRARSRVRRLEAHAVPTGPPDIGWMTLQDAATKRKDASMSKSRQDDDVKNKPYLAGLLKSGRFSDARSLFRAADLPVAEFYKQLAWEIDEAYILDKSDELKAA